MAAKHFYRQGFLLLLFNFISTAALEKRFSDFKRCADEECSMLLCRGKAIKDFSGPDCRFLKVKKSETIYVYYKLSGRRADIWAGSVGSHFGYFPNDLLAVNHRYTDKEIEVPAEETDFVCFDTGFDKFDNYDIDLLLGSLLEENDEENNITSDQIQTSENEQKETQPSAEEATEQHDNSEDLDDIPEAQSASSPELGVAAATPSPEVEQSDTAATPGAPEGAAEHTQVEKNKVLSNIENVPEKRETKEPTTYSQVVSVPEENFASENEPITISEGAQIPELKTTFGTTFDAVTTEDEITKNVTPYEEEEGEDVENHPKEDVDVIAETPLLSFSKETINTPASDSLIKHNTAATPGAPEGAAEHTQVEKNAVVSKIENVPEKSKTKEPSTHSHVESVPEEDFALENEPVTISKGAQIPELKTTFGTTFDAVTTEDEITKSVTPYEEEESENVDNQPEEDVDVIEETPLLSFSKETINTPASDSLIKHESPPTTHDEKPEVAEEKTVWTSIGDAVFSVVSGGKRTAQEVSSEEDDDEDEEAVPTTPPSIVEKKQLISVESSKEPKNIEPALFNGDNESDADVIRPPDASEETLKPTGVPVHHQTEASTRPVDPVSQFDTSAIHKAQNTDDKTTDEPIEHEEDEDEEEEQEEQEEEEEEEEGELEDDNDVSKDSEVNNDNDSIVVMEHSEDLDNELDENEAVPNLELAGTETETQQDPITEETESDVKDDEKTADESLPYHTHDHLTINLERNNSQPELSVEGPDIQMEHLSDEEEKEIQDKKEGEKEELLDDENALSFLQSDNKGTEPFPETARPTAPTPEPEYSDSVMRLTLLRDHFTVENMEKLQKLLGLMNLFKVEAMFSDLDIELQATSHTGTTQDIESALEASENAILDEVEKMLDSRKLTGSYDQHADTGSLDEETEILDDFQELAFSLRQKYSTASDSTPLAKEKASDEHRLQVKEDIPHIVEEDKVDGVPEPESDDNLTVTEQEERPAETKEDPMVLGEAHSGPDVSVEHGGGHFNKNKDNQLIFSASDEIQEVPQATPENPLEMDLGVEVEPSPSGSLDSVGPVSEIHEEEIGLFSTVMVYMGCILLMIKGKIVEWTIEVISLLPEEWKPGETLFGCPWQAVVITALIGVVTFTLFFWRTVLAVKKREYLVDEKRLAEQILALKKEKDDSLAKMSELQKQTEQLKENQKQSQETVGCTIKRMQDLESKVLEAETRNEHIAEEKNRYTKLLEDERASSLQNGNRIEKLEKSNEKLQLSRKKIQETLSKTAVLLDEAKIREEARKVQHKCLERDYSAIKEENKTLKVTIKNWEDKHKELNEQIKVYQKSQKELEDSVVLKDHNVEVLSELLADLDACDLQKSDTKVLANGEVAPVSFSDKKTAVKNRIKQMMDISRVQTTLTVVEEERDRFMTKLLNEEKTRKSLEEQHQELEHAIATIKSEKSHVENQFKVLQQKNEIMVEMYQQKENALQQRLTKEELERRSKESQLSEVGGKAVEAEGQVKVLRQRINEMEDQMKKTEEVYKEQIKEQENKTHSNWVNARNAERALNQEKLESSKLREKLAVLTSQLNERRAPLFRPNSGQPAGPRQGDSYGPSPVSGGAPSPPIMIEGPRRPPSAPVGRRIDPYGPRPPSDPHGRYPESKHISGMDMMGPRSSSPANLDISAPGSFLASPIRDSPGHMVQGPGPGPHDQLLPPGPHPGRLPPPGSYRAPRPGLYHLPPGPHGPLPPHITPHHGPPLPANGQPGMPLPGPIGGEFGPRPANGHAFHPRPAPAHVIDPRGPPLPHFRPPPPHHFGPMPLPHGVRGPMGPRPPVPLDMRYPGPRDHNSPPTNLPPGAQLHPAHGDTYGPTPPDTLHNSHTGPRPQDLHVKQEAPQDSARPAMVKP
ncbi:transport and Golgi organization protein 1 homolog isoform X2 [Clinocottus analis]|uniref:transport and Golgi organization protein 1 homolog isoform X2 n=1 Tax=Clinocottus analis TaxID=304258 RepID=UPI0035C1DAB1